MQALAPRFVITGFCGTIMRRDTRTKAALAMVLADRLFREGYRKIRVIDPEGISYERDRFRLTLPLVKRLGSKTNCLVGERSKPAL